MIDLQVDHVSKRYRIRQEETASATEQTLMGRLRRLRPPKRDFWALRDVSFEVQRGESLGIIGANGAGKSTILKLLSNITTPTSGEITINGRLSALIEVGSGFHPELTGRENIFLSGSILGMRRREIAAKLDSIVDFAGLTQFLDVPVKRYSSGMYVRLGFSIAAHLDPDILLLDEVLAVGDASFQAKCLDRIKELETAGTTIVFISHDLIAVERVCDRAILLQRGEIIADGPPQEVIDKYNNAPVQGGTTVFRGVGALREWDDRNSAPGDDVVRLRSVRVCTEDGKTAPAVDIRHPVGIEITYDVLSPGYVLVPHVKFFNEARIHLFDVLEVNPEWRRKTRPVQRYVSTAWIPGNFLSEGSLILNIGINTHVPVGVIHVDQRDVVAFTVVDNLTGDDTARGDYTGPWPGMVRPMVNWTTQLQDNNNPSKEFREELPSPST
jgi:lipopolysaccharide transport system ATP-binding protein